MIVRAEISYRSILKSNVRRMKNIVWRHYFQRVEEEFLPEAKVQVLKHPILNSWCSSWLRHLIAPTVSKINCSVWLSLSELRCQIPIWWNIDRWIACKKVNWDDWYLENFYWPKFLLVQTSIYIWSFENLHHRPILDSRIVCQTKDTPHYYIWLQYIIVPCDCILKASAFDIAL